MIIQVYDLQVHPWKSDSRAVYWGLTPDTRNSRDCLLDVNCRYRPHHGWECFVLNRQFTYMRRPDFILYKWSKTKLAEKMNWLLEDKEILKFIFDRIWKKDG